MSVTVEGSPIDVSVTSSSTISAFNINEESKTLSFRTSGTGTETVIAVGAVLEGPYTVMVDGQATEAEESQEDGVSTLTVPHSSGDHEVTVTGSQVVPEFPVAMIGVIAVVIGVVAVVGRTKVFRSKI